MTTIEDNWTVETPEVTTTEPEVTTTEQEVTTTEPEVTTTEPEVTTTEPEVTTTEPDQNTIDERTNNLSVEEMDELLKAITDWIWEEDEEIISRPTHFKWEDNDDYPITVDELWDALNVIEELDSKLDESESKTIELSTQLEELNKKLEAEIREKQSMEEIFSSIIADPIIWQFAEQIAKWEKPNIPDIIQKQLQKEISSIPNIESSEQVIIPKQELTMADRIYNAKTM